MARKKRKRTAAEKKAKREHKKKWKDVLINSKHRRQAQPVYPWNDDEWLRRNADPTMLHILERWDLMDQEYEPAFEPNYRCATIDELMPEYEPATISELVGDSEDQIETIDELMDEPVTIRELAYSTEFTVVDEIPF